MPVLCLLALQLDLAILFGQTVINGSEDLRHHILQYTRSVSNDGSNKQPHGRTSTIGADKYRERTLCNVTVSFTRSTM